MRAEVPIINQIFVEKCYGNVTLLTYICGIDNIGAFSSFNNKNTMIELPTFTTLIYKTKSK